MSLFSTEFLLNDSVGPAQFLAEARAWVQGMRQTALFDADSVVQTDGDHVSYEARSGEKLMIRVLRNGSDMVAAGCRHDISDPRGRHWRTEAVMRCTPQGNLLRLRAQCLPLKPFVATETPKRTHLIRSLIENGRVRADGPLAVQTFLYRPSENLLMLQRRR